MADSKKKPGVYVSEINPLANVVQQVATAVPAFIGYTPQALYEGKSYLNVPQKITSFQEFLAIYGYPKDAATHARPKQYTPQFALAQVDRAPERGSSYVFGGKIYTLQPDQSTIYYLYNMVQSYYQNGGAEAYIVSVGPYRSATGDSLPPGGSPANSNVKLNELLTGLASLTNAEEVTMYVMPEATLLAPADNGVLMGSALEQAGTLQTCMAIFDVIGGWDPDPILWTQDIENFRNATGSNSLKFGAAYYPYLKTTLMDIDQFDYTQLNGGDVKTLEPVLNPPTDPNPAAASVLASILAGKDLSVAQYNAALTQSSKTYKQIMAIMQEIGNIIPPSGTMAGVWTLTDSTTGVFMAPANVAPTGVTDLTLSINDAEQAGLNVDAVSGKSINAIRHFNGQGILVWGARTLDGNSQDWRYIPVRRTVTMIEQSLKLALHNYVYSPNDANTWQAVMSMASDFLTNLWKSGALQGATPQDAFSVTCGLGKNMTAQDILDGLLRLTVKLAITHPAEFIVLTIEQQIKDRS
ncbi:MAG: phage tail sheath C-terminal domain-containing protein [Cyclobacteriaceae bacterium]